MAYRDDHGHFVSKQEDGKKCTHSFESGMESAFRENGIKGKPNSKTADTKRIESEKARIDEFVKENARISKKGNKIIDYQKAKSLGLEIWGSNDNLTFTIDKVFERNGKVIDFNYNPLSGEETYIVRNDYGSVGIGDSESTFDKAIEKLDELERKDKNERELREFHEKNLEEGDIEANKWLSASDEEIEKNFSDEVLTKGTRVGGYSGISRSKSAEASEQLGSKPISKWTSKDILEEIEKSAYSDELEPFRKKLESLSLAGLKRVTLYHDGWHHVGINATPTDFYAINSPRDIVKNLKKELGDKFKKGFREVMEKGMPHL